MSTLHQAFFETLLKTQFLPPDRMLSYQRGLIERLLRHARTHVPFYRDRAHLDVLFRHDDTIDWGRWQDVPVLTRAEAQENAERLYAEVVPPECGELKEGYTAGSTGTPLPFRVNTIVAAAGTAMLERGFVWAGLPADFSLAWFRNDKSGDAAYPHGISYEMTMRGVTRPMHHLAVQTPVEEQGRWLARLRPGVVMGYPGALALLAQCLPPALDDHRFLLAVCVGEVTTDAMRTAIEHGFRCPVMDLYSGSEFGPVAVEDGNLRRLLLCEETILVELREPQQFSGLDRGLAEVIFTPFYNYAMPLIRYAPGDFAVADAAPAPDERTLRRLTRVAGRDRNVFVLPNGRRWWPTYQNKILREFLDYKQIQFAQTTRNCIEIRFASDNGEPIKDAEGLAAYLRAATPETMEVTVKRVAEIARRSSGKFEYATCEIDPLPDRQMNAPATPEHQAASGITDGQLGKTGP